MYVCTIKQKYKTIRNSLLLKRWKLFRYDMNLTCYSTITNGLGLCYVFVWIWKRQRQIKISLSTSSSYRQTHTHTHLQKPSGNSILIVVAMCLYKKIFNLHTFPSSFNHIAYRMLELLISLLFVVAVFFLIKSILICCFQNQIKIY